MLRHWEKRKQEEWKGRGRVPVQLVLILFDSIKSTSISIITIISSHPCYIPRKRRQRCPNERMCIGTYRLFHHTNMILIQMIIP